MSVHDLIHPGRAAPPAPARLAPAAAFTAAAEQLASAGRRLGLLRLSDEERKALGPVQATQIRKSLAALRLLRKRPDLASRLRTLSPTEWQSVLDLRLAIGQARAALAPVRRGLGAAELVLLGALTRCVDQVEDWAAARIADESLPAAERHRIQARYANAEGVRARVLETQEQRQQRRARRVALGARELARKKAEIARLRGAEVLRAAPLPGDSSERRS